jgi:hypothetical protein
VHHARVRGLVHEADASLCTAHSNVDEVLITILLSYTMRGFAVHVVFAIELVAYWRCVNSKHFGLSATTSSRRLR